DQHAQRLGVVGGPIGGHFSSFAEAVKGEVGSNRTRHSSSFWISEVDMESGNRADFHFERQYVSSLPIVECLSMGNALFSNGKCFNLKVGDCLLLCQFVDVGVFGGGVGLAGTMGGDTKAVDVVAKGFNVIVEEAKLWCLGGDLRNACSSNNGCDVGTVDRIGEGIEEVESVQKSRDGECSVDRVVKSVEDGHKLVCLEDVEASSKRLLENSFPNFPGSNFRGFPVVINGVVRVFQGDFAKVVCDSRGPGSVSRRIERKKVKVSFQ
ncbi:hypothetical protein Dimus_008435, partial [Dionaea muscipula]